MRPPQPCEDRRGNAGRGSVTQRSLAFLPPPAFSYRVPRSGEDPLECREKRPQVWRDAWRWEQQGHQKQVWTCTRGHVAGRAHTPDRF